MKSLRISLFELAEVGSSARQFKSKEIRQDFHNHSSFLIPHS